MRRIKIRDLRKNLSKHLKKLPFMITKHGEAVALVSEVPEGFEGFTKLDTKKIKTFGGLPKKNFRVSDELKDDWKFKPCKHGVSPALCKDGKCRKT